MSTPYTLMRHRMKDLISCFNACKLPIENDADELDHPKATASSIGGDRNREREKKVETETTVEKRGGEESPASWRSCESEEDEYIVFYFKDDDANKGIIEESSSERRQEVVGSIRRKKKNVPETKGRNESLSESSESSSTSSFVFPTIEREWTGTPVLMPRPEGYNKSGGVCIQCCKF